MQNAHTVSLGEPDAAAVFAAALSIWRVCHEHARVEGVNLSECYGGADELMRVAMRVAYEFEVWACENVDFELLGEVWPYFLEANFGRTCLKVVPLTALTPLDADGYLKVAFALRLPFRAEATISGPVDAYAPHPTATGRFVGFRIQSVRHFAADNIVEPFTYDDDPLDPCYSSPFLGLYGVSKDGLVEHIADRATFSEAIALAEKIAPGVHFTRSRC